MSTKEKKEHDSTDQYFLFVLLKSQFLLGIVRWQRFLAFMLFSFFVFPSVEVKR